MISFKFSDRFTSFIRSTASVASFALLAFSAAFAQDAVYFVAGPQDAPGNFSDSTEGRLVRLDPATGLFDTISGVVQSAVALPAPPQIAGVYKEEGGSLFVFSAPVERNPYFRIYERTTSATLPALRFEAIPPDGQLLGSEFLKLSDTQFMGIARRTGYPGIVIYDLEEQKMTPFPGVITSGPSVDVASKSLVSISRDYQRIERFYWETGVSEVLANIDYSSNPLPAQPQVSEFSVNSSSQTAEMLVQGTEPIGSGTPPRYNTVRFAYSFNYSGPSAVITDRERNTEFDRVIRIFGGFITRFDDIATNYSTALPLTPQPFANSHGRYSLGNRGFYRFSPQVFQASPTQFYYVVEETEFAPDYTSSTTQPIRIDFPEVRPATVRGSGPPIEAPFFGAAQVLPGTVAGTVNVLHPGGFLRVDLATGDRTEIAEFPVGFNFRGGGAALFSVIAALGTEGRPPTPGEYVNHLIAIQRFNAQTVAPDRNFDGDINSGDMVRRQNEVEVLP